MNFGAPVLLLLLGALVPVLAALLWLARWRRAAARRLVSGAAARVSRRRLLKAGLALAALALIVVGAARPQRGSRKLLLPREGTDVMVTLDVSASMLATDVEPNRFERAKAVLNSLLDRLQGDRVGLVAFAGTAGLRFPLTTDVAAARELIRTVSIRDGGLGPGTGLGDAIRLATTAFPPENQTRSKVMLLVTDGEDLAGAPQDAVAVARGRGIVLYTVGVGTEAGGTIVAPGRGGQPEPRTDPQTGEPATSHRDEGLLRSLAVAGKGRYVDGNGDDAAPILADEVGRLERTHFESQEGSLPIERFQWAAAAALLLLALDFLVGESSRARDRGSRRPAAGTRGAKKAA